MARRGHQHLENIDFEDVLAELIEKEQHGSSAQSHASVSPMRVCYCAHVQEATPEPLCVDCDSPSGSTQGWSRFVDDGMWTGLRGAASPRMDPSPPLPPVTDNVPSAESPRVCNICCEEISLAHPNA